MSKTNDADSGLVRETTPCKSDVKEKEEGGLLGSLQKLKNALDAASEANDAPPPTDMTPSHDQGIENHPFNHHRENA